MCTMLEQSSVLRDWYNFYSFQHSISRSFQNFKINEFACVHLTP